MSNEVRSPLIVLSQAERSCPGGLLQSSVRCSKMSVNALCFQAVHLVCSSGQILLSQYLENALNSFDKTEGGI